MIWKKKINSPKVCIEIEFLFEGKAEEGEAEWGISCWIFHYIRQPVCDKQKQLKFSFLIYSDSLEIMHMNIVL